MYEQLKCVEYKNSKFILYLGMKHTALAIITMGALAALTSCEQNYKFSETEGVPSAQSI